MPLSTEILLALVVFSLVSSITPGPNNLMLLSSGVNFGFVRTIPHMIGIEIGFLVLLLCVGFGLGEIASRSPLAYTVLKVAGGLYLLYLAYRIATTRSMAKSDATARPMRFIEAALFQWVNPKAWVMAIAAMAAYSNTEYPVASIVMVAVVFSLSGLPSVTVWTGFGMGLRQFLADETRLVWFNRGMAFLLVLSLWPMLR